MHAYLTLGLELLILAIFLHALSQKTERYKIAGNLWGLYPDAPSEPPTEGSPEAHLPAVRTVNSLHGPDCHCMEERERNEQNRAMDDELTSKE